MKIKVIAYSGKFKEYIVFESIKECSRLFCRYADTGNSPALIRRYWIDTGKNYLCTSWKITEKIPEEWFVSKEFKLVDIYTATYNVNSKGEPYSYKHYPRKPEDVD